MLPAPHRLPAKDVRLVLATGKRIQTQDLTIYYRGATRSKIAFVVSTRVDKRATVRNRMRRVLSEEARGLLPSVSSVDAVVVVKKKITNGSLTSALTRGGLLLKQ